MKNSLLLSYKLFAVPTTQHFGLNPIQQNSKGTFFLTCMSLLIKTRLGGIGNRRYSVIPNAIKKHNENMTIVSETSPH